MKLTKTEQRVAQEITNALLEDNTTISVVTRCKDFERCLEEGTPLLDTYNKFDSDKVGVVIGGVLRPYEEMVLYFKHVDTPPQHRYIDIPKQIPMEDIYSYLTKIGTTWKGLSYKEKLELLWHGGLNVKDGGSKYWVDMAMYRGRDNKVKSGLVITAQERTDKAWIDSGNASYEATIHTDDWSLKKELMGMSGSIM